MYLNLVSGEHLKKYGALKADFKMVHCTPSTGTMNHIVGYVNHGVA